MSEELVRSRPHPATDLAAAIGFLTSLPLGRSWREDRPPRAVGYYPWVGWLLGGVAALACLSALRISGHSPVGGAFVSAALVVGGWAYVTRFLHWDGLADTADGLWGARDRERRLEIMRDSRVGSFGVAAILFTALVQVGAVADVLHAGAVWPLLAAPVLGRAAVSIAAWTLPAARREGLGLTAVGRAGLYDVVAWAIAVGGLALLPLLGVQPMSLLAACSAGLFAGIVIPRALARPIGGMTGDLMGATVLLTEVVVLVVGAMLA